MSRFPLHLSARKVENNQRIKKVLVISVVLTFVGLYVAIFLHHHPSTPLMMSRNHHRDPRTFLDQESATGKQATSRSSHSAARDRPGSVKSAIFSHGGDHTHQVKHALTVPVTIPPNEPWYELHGRKLPLIITDANAKEVMSYHVHKPYNAVIISTFRGGIKPLELKFAKNMFVQFGKFGQAEKLMVFCTTKATCVNAWRQNVPLYLNAIQHNGADPSPDPTVTKWQLAYQVLKAGYNVLFVDFDLGLQCDVFPHFDTVSDIQILWDEFYMGREKAGCTNAAMTTVAGQMVSGYCASTGFWFIRAKPYMAEFTKQIYERSLSAWEQSVFNTVVKAWDAKSMQVVHAADAAGDALLQHLTVNVLTYPHFVNIINIDELTKRHGLKVEEVCMLHCGAINNGEPKSEALIKYGIFDPDAYKGTSVNLEGYGADVVIPYFDPKRLDTIWI